ncbi:ABC transporter permease, partial [Sphingopyxis granuli]
MTGASGPRTGLPAMRRFDPKRLWALVRKESLQAIRDPSTLLIAFALPVVLLLLFSYAVSLDVRAVRIGVVQESGSASAQSLAAAFAGTRYLDVTFAHDRREVAERVVSGSLRGFVVIPQDFEQRLAARGAQPLVQIIADGSQPNTANYVANYAQGVVQNWRGGLDGEIPRAAVTMEPRYWFNAELESRRAL